MKIKSLIMKTQEILVLGGTGKTGSKIVERLTKLQLPHRIGSRSAQLPFDWEKPELWDTVLQGIKKVYISFQPDLAVPHAPSIIQNFCKKAIESGVQKLILLSGRGEKEAEHCEQLVMNSGADWTIIRADWFNQNFSDSFLRDPILAGQVALPRSEALIPFVDTDDIADVALEALLEEKHNGKVYELTGPRLLTFRQVIEEIAQASKRSIHYHSISLEAYQNMLREYQIPEDFIWLIGYLFSEVLDGRNSSITQDVKNVLGRPPKDIRQYIQETAAKGIWTPSKEAITLS